MSRERGAPAGRGAESAAWTAEAQARLEAGVHALGLSLTDEQLHQFGAFARLLDEGRRAINLTTLSDPLDVAEKHFLDSLTVLDALPVEARGVIDVGTGAGFPGVPLKIARPELRLTLLEATGKKTAWLGWAVDELGLDGVTVVNDRAEAAAHQAHLREAFDIAVARAVAPLPVLVELCLPFARVGGAFIAQKTTTALDAELAGARRALHLLGGQVERVKRIEHPALPNRALVVIRHTRSTPAAYPRRPGLPSKKPL